MRQGRYSGRTAPTLETVCAASFNLGPRYIARLQTKTWWSTSMLHIQHHRPWDHHLCGCSFQETQCPHGDRGGGDVLAEPFSPEEVVGQFRRTKRSAPGIDGITYATWRWVDPLGTILAIIFNVCRLNKKVPSAWKHSTVTLIHKGGMWHPSGTGEPSACS